MLVIGKFSFISSLKTVAILEPNHVLFFSSFFSKSNPKVKEVPVSIVSVKPILFKLKILSEFKNLDSVFKFLPSFCSVGCHRCPAGWPGQRSPSEWEPYCDLTCNSLRNNYEL